MPRSFHQPGKIPLNLNRQLGSLLILLAVSDYPLWLIGGRGLLAATPLFSICATLGTDRSSAKRLDFIAELMTQGPV